MLALEGKKEDDTNPFIKRRSVANLIRKRSTIPIHPSSDFSQKDIPSDNQTVSNLIHKGAFMENSTRIQEIERAVDFSAVNEKLRKLAESGPVKCRKTLADVLDKVKESLMRARQNGMGTEALADFLKENGIPVSKGSLHNYFKAQEGGGNGKQRKKKVRAPKSGPEQPSLNHAAASLPEVTPSWKKPLSADEAERKTLPRSSRRNPL